MALGRTPVSVKTDLARKYDIKERVNRENARSVGNGISGNLPDSVKSAIADSHQRINSQRDKITNQIAALYGRFEKGDMTVISEMTRLLVNLPVGV